MLNIVDRHGEYVIQKVTTPRGKLIGYQAVIPGNSDTLKQASSLTEVRAAIGRVIWPPARETKPKSQCPHNTPGYRAQAAGKGNKKRGG